MDLALLVYGISILGKMEPVLGITIGFTIASLFIALLYRFIALNVESWDGAETIKRKKENRIPTEKWIKRFFGILAVTTIFAVAIPSEKTAYMMVGAYATQKIAENDKVQETGQKVLSIINQKLDSYIEDGLKQVENKSKK